MKHCFNAGLKRGATKKGELFEEHLKSLTPVPKAIEVEMETCHIGGGYGLAHSQPLQTWYKPLLKDNVAIGRYIYE